MYQKRILCTALLHLFKLTNTFESLIYVLDTRDMEVNKAAKAPAIIEITFYFIYFFTVNIFYI